MIMNSRNTAGAGDSGDPVTDLMQAMRKGFIFVSFVFGGDECFSRGFVLRLVTRVSMMVFPMRFLS